MESLEKGTACDTGDWECLTIARRVCGFKETQAMLDASGSVGGEVCGCIAC